MVPSHDLKQWWPGLSVDIFCWGSGGPTIWLSKGPKQNLKGPYIEIDAISPKFFGSIGPSSKISQGLHWIFRGPGRLPPGPRKPWVTHSNNSYFRHQAWMCLNTSCIVFFIFFSQGRLAIRCWKMGLQCLVLPSNRLVWCWNPNDPLYTKTESE